MGNNTESVTHSDYGSANVVQANGHQKSGETDIFSTLPGEILTLIGQFIPYKDILNFFSIKKTILPDLRRTGYFEIMCRNMGVHVNEGKSSERIFFEAMKNRILVKFEIKRFRGNLNYRNGQIFESFKGMDSRSREFKGKEEVILDPPNFQFCKDLSCQISKSFRMDNKFTVTFRINSKKMSSVKFGFIFLRIGSSTSDGDFVCIIPGSGNISSGEEVSVSVDKKLDVMLYSDGRERLIEKSLAAASTEFKDDEMLRIWFYAKLGTWTDKLKIISLYRESVDL